MMKLLNLIVLPLMLLGCGHSALGNISETNIAKKLDFRTTLYVENGEALPSEPFTYLNAGRYQIWILMLVGPDKKGDFHNIGLSSEFYGELNLTANDGKVINVIRVNRNRSSHSIGTLMTDVLVLPGKYKTQQIQLTAENLNLPNQCRVDRCKVMLQIRKFTFNNTVRPFD